MRGGRGQLGGQAFEGGALDQPVPCLRLTSAGGGWLCACCVVPAAAGSRRWLQSREPPPLSSPPLPSPPLPSPPSPHQEHGECETIKTRFRPVPLRWLFAYAGGGQRGPGAITDLLDASGRGLNPKISIERFIKAEARWAPLRTFFSFHSVHNSRQSAGYSCHWAPARDLSPGALPHLGAGGARGRREARRAPLRGARGDAKGGRGRRSSRMARCHRPCCISDDVRLTPPLPSRLRCAPAGASSRAGAAPRRGRTRRCSKRRWSARCGAMRCVSAR